MNILNSQFEFSSSSSYSSLIVLAVVIALSPFNTFANEIEIIKAGNEQLAVSPWRTSCTNSLLPDSPLRLIHHKDGSVVGFATHYDNWPLVGASPNNLRPLCASTVRGSENADPYAVDDHYWIQALWTKDGVNVNALASHEYMGSRHPGHCEIQPTHEQPFPCWYSSIIQLRSVDGGRKFFPFVTNLVVARPQIPFNVNDPKRVGFLTTSNIVQDGEWNYVLIYVDGYNNQVGGTCIFRSKVNEVAPRWLAWDGMGFSVPLGATAGDETLNPLLKCQPVSLGNINRGLVKHKESNSWIAVGLDKDSTKKQSGVFYSVSKDLIHWEPRRLLLEAQIAFEAPSCPAVYKYPSIIDHEATGFNFDSVGDSAFVYLVRVNFESCKPVNRDIVRIPIKINKN